MVIYTKKGDKGLTGLFEGKKVLKSSSVIAAIGALDEVNSYLGIVKTTKDIGRKTKEVIEKIQIDLFTIGAILGGAKVKWPSKRVAEIERQIAKLEHKLPRQKYFILPGGTLVAAHLMYARALVRHAEREVVGLRHEQILPYLNRLSDYLFILARWENYKNKFKEIVWKPKN